MAGLDKWRRAGFVTSCHGPGARYGFGIRNRALIMAVPLNA